MQLKKIRTRIVKEEQLENLLKNGILISKTPTKYQGQDGYYLVKYTAYDMSSYKDLTKKLIREKYSQEDELKIHRETFNNPSNPEFTEYNIYVEQCKVQARAFITERFNAIGK